VLVSLLALLPLAASCLTNRQRRPFSEGEDIAATADDNASAVFFRDRDQGNVGDEIDVEEKRLLAFGKMPFSAEEAAIERLSAGPVDRREHAFFVNRLQSAHFELAAVAQPFHRGVFRCFHHDPDTKLGPEHRPSMAIRAPSSHARERRMAG
jgi:hypothetical protein